MTIASLLQLSAADADTANSKVKIIYYIVEGTSLAKCK